MICADYEFPSFSRPLPSISLFRGPNEKEGRKVGENGQGELFNLVLVAGTWHWLKPSPVTKVKVK